MRGSLTVSYNTLVVAGQFTATLVCGAFSHVSQGWRWMLGLAGLPALLQFVGFVFMPESPRWLLSKEREEEARRVLRRIRPAGEDIELEINDIKNNIEKDGDVGNFVDVGKRILRHQPTRRALVLGCSLQLFQQISGINTIMYYSATVVQMAGIGSASSAIWITAGINALYLLACGLGILGVERLGRRRLLLASLAGVVLSLLAIAVAFQEADTNTPVLAPSNSSCSPEAVNCLECLQSESCGFCYNSQEEVGSCLTGNSSQYSLSGPCSEAGARQDLIN